MTKNCKGCAFGKAAEGKQTTTKHRDVSHSTFFFFLLLLLLLIEIYMHARTVYIPLCRA